MNDELTKAFSTLYGRAVQTNDELTKAFLMFYKLLDQHYEMYKREREKAIADNDIPRRRLNNIKADVVVKIMKDTVGLYSNCIKAEGERNEP